MLQLDDALQVHNLALTGKGAVAGVAISHPGLVLFPLDSQQLRDSQGEVQLGGALVPLEALEGGLSDGEASSEEPCD